MMASLGFLSSRIAAFTIAVVSVCSSAEAQTLYAVSVRTYSDPAYKGVEGSLYRVDPYTAVTTLVAPLRLDGRDSVGLDGLAIDPTSGEFFGITAPIAAMIPHSLVRLDPINGNVSLIGNLDAAGSDIGFDAEGTLFVWLPTTSQLGKIDMKTGRVTKLGIARQARAAIGGFTITRRGVALIAGSGANGTLDSIDLKTGVVTAGVPLTGAHYPELINGLASSPDGTLFGVNTNGGAPALADLVTIDQRTGAVTTIGPLPNDTDALTFGPVLAGGNHWDVEKLRSVLVPVLIVFGIGFLIFFRKWLRL
jgi:hypothetical protein